MDWYKQRTGYYLDPEMIDAGEEAETLYNRAKSYAAQTESGGYIPAAALPLITPKRPAQRAAKLVQAGLWLPVRDGYLIADWDEEQSGLEALASRRRADRDRKRAQRDRDRARPMSRDNGADPSRDSHGGVRSDLDTELEEEKELPPDSLRESAPPPDNRDTEPDKPAPKRGTRIPDDFALTDEMRAWGEANFPQVNGQIETDAFVDYWRAIPGQRGTKLDWPATWRNWIRKSAERRPQGLPRTAAAASDLGSDEHMARFLARTAARKEPT